MRFGEEDEAANASGEGDADAPGSWFTPTPKPPAERAGFGHPGSAGSWFDPLSRGDQGRPGSPSPWGQAVPESRAEWPSLQEPSLQEPSPEQPSPQEPSPQEASPREPSPEQASLQAASPEQASPEQASPEQASLQAASPEQASLQAASPQEASPEQAGPEQASPEQAGSGQSRPENPGADPDRTVTRSDMPALPGGTRRWADWRAGSWAEVTRGANSPPWPSITTEPDSPLGPPGLPSTGARPVPGLGTLKSASAPAGPPSAFRRTQTGAFRRIRDTGAMRAIMDTNAMRTLMDTTAMQILRERYAGRGRLVAAVVISIWVLLAIIGVVVFSQHGVGPPTASAASSATRAGTGLASRPATPSPPAGRKASGTGSPARVLTVASVVAFGPHGTSDGDNPGRAASVIEGGAAASWQTKWYATAHFGSLKSGTGLLLNMGETVTISAVELKLTPGSADLKIRVGRTVRSLVLAATRAGVGGTVYVHLARPATGRYVEIWFTALPRDTTGTYQETVYEVQVRGRS